MCVCRLLRQHLAELGGCAEQTSEQLGLYKSDMSPEMVRLQPHIPTLLAYKQLADAGVTGAPVVSADGQLIANLSISDIRYGLKEKVGCALQRELQALVAAGHVTAAAECK